VGCGWLPQIRTGIQPHIQKNAQLTGIKLALVDESDKWNVRGLSSAPESPL